MSAHDFAFKTIDGKPLAMKDLAGKAVLVVNVASYCGFTPQYTELEKLHETYGPKGLVVLGEGALPKWNFHKYLIGKDGGLIDGWPSRVRPAGPEITTAVESALG